MIIEEIKDWIAQGYMVVSNVKGREGIVYFKDHVLYVQSTDNIHCAVEFNDYNLGAYLAGGIVTLYEQGLIHAQ